MESRSRSEVLGAEYDLRFAKMQDYRNSVWKILCKDFFSRYIPSNATVLDVGCGWGEFINNIEAEKKFALDLNTSAQEHLSTEINFVNQDCSERWPFDDEHFDVVFTSNFLEHLPDKDRVEATLREAHRCLKKGGRIICLGPNIRYVNGAYWDFWDHHVPLSDASIAEVLKLNDFGIERCVPRFLPYSMSDGSNPPLLAVKMYLKLPVAWPLFGKQFLVVGKKQVG